MKKKPNPYERPPEYEARAVIKGMLVVTFVLAVFIALTDWFDLTVKSMILIAWIGVMLAVLRRYRI